MSESQIQISASLDVRGLLCPFPLSKAKEKFKELKDLEILEIISDDPSSPIDFEVFARQSSHKMLNSWQEGNNFFYWIQK